MLRLIRLQYPNSIRGKLFTEWAMESAKDSIKYVRPIYSKMANSTDLGATKTFGTIGDGSDTTTWPLKSDTYNKATYEQAFDRYPSELANGTFVADADPDVDTAVLSFTGGAFGTSAADYIDGYAAIFYKTENQPLALQNRDGSFMLSQYVIDGSAAYRIASITPVSKGVYNVAVETATVTNGVPGTFAAVENTELAVLDGNIKCFARFNSEGDFNGDFLGSVEIAIAEYIFKPRPITMGISWNEMAEIVLDTSFGVNSEELFMKSATEEIKKSNDFRAVKMAYHNALVKGTALVTFNAAGGDGSDDSYLHTAQTISQAIERVGDIMYNDLLRGGVTRLVGGPAAVSYLRLNSGFTTKGAQERIGGYQVGELYGIPVFKVPSSIIPDDEILTVWNNTSNPGDVAIAFGVLIPFYSTGVLQRKNFYKEAGLATFEDSEVLNPKYLGRIKITGLRTLE